MKKHVVAMLIFFLYPAMAVSVFTEYMNTNGIPFVQQSFGLGMSTKALNIPIHIGVEHFSIRTHGTIHEPMNQNMIAAQHVLAFPFSLSIRWSPRPSLYVKTSLGVKVYSAASLDSAVIHTIYQKTSITGAPLIQDYSEQLSPNLFYKLELSYRFLRRWQVSFAKTWSQMTSIATFTFLNQYQVKKESVFHYDPISISIAYSF